MVNFNGAILDAHPLADNRGLLYGDGIFETVKVIDGKVLFLEDHYFRLMSGMRIVRMEIPMAFTMEYFAEQILQTAQSSGCDDAARVRLTVFRDSAGLYLPETNKTAFVASARPVSAVYGLEKEIYEVELFRDFYLSAQLLSTVKSTNRLLNVTASIFAQENGYDNCLLVNEQKNVAEAVNSNLFMRNGNVLVTPPTSQGCVDGIMRKQVLALARKVEGLQVEESIISPFDLQKADELFLTNVITGIQPITRYRKKDFVTDMAQTLVKTLNAQLAS